MHVLYLSDQISISETFISELSKGLSTVLDVSHVVAHEPFYSENINFRIVKYDVSAKIVKWFSYLLESRGKKYIYYLRKKKAVQKLKDTVKNADVVFVEYGTTAVKILPLIEKYGNPVVVHFHGFDITSQLGSSWYQKDLKKLYELGSSFIAASFHIKRLLVLNGCPQNKVEVVRLGINIPPEILHGNIPYKLKKNDFIFIGRLTPKKNPVALIHAFKIVLESNPGVHLQLVGDGPLMKTCQKLIIALRIEKNVHLFGSLPHQKGLELLKKSKIYVQHSITSISGDQEGFAISVAEAAMMEMPVVSTLHNGIPENVIDGVTGFLVREFDYESMADKMIELLNNPYLAEKMGKSGKEHISSLCSSKERIERISGIIKSAI